MLRENIESPNIIRPESKLPARLREHLLVRAVQRAVFPNHFEQSDDSLCEVAERQRDCRRNLGGHDAPPRHFQIPAAAYVPRIGYKRFVYGGWGMRVMFIFLMALSPLTGKFLNEGARLSLILALSFLFNLSRGISSCAWLPWITALLPTSLRGKYLAGDAACMNAGSCLTFLVAGLLLGDNPHPWQFAAAFAFSALTGFASLEFLKRIPDAPVANDPAATSSQPVPWRELASFPPFRKLLRMNIAWSFAFGGQVAFTAAYLRGMGKMSEGSILIVSSVFFLGGLLSLTIGRGLDRLGSKPALIFSASLWLAIILGWSAVAGGLFPLTLHWVLALQFLMGFAASTFNMANVRLAMVISPEMGRTHFFAIFSVVANLTLGLAPVLWGLLIDAFGKLNLEWHSFSVNRYSLFYLGTGVLFAITLVLMRLLDEPTAARVEELIRDILLTSPQRFWARVFTRL
jgi:MFS family permease